jgi:hypothetical protein
VTTLNPPIGGRIKAVSWDATSVAIVTATTTALNDYEIVATDPAGDNPVPPDTWAPASAVQPVLPGTFAIADLKPYHAILTASAIFIKTITITSSKEIDYWVDAGGTAGPSPYAPNSALLAEFNSGLDNILTSFDTAHIVFIGRDITGSSNASGYNAIDPGSPPYSGVPTDSVPVQYGPPLEGFKLPDGAGSTGWQTLNVWVGAPEYPNTVYNNYQWYVIVKGTEGPTGVDIHNRIWLVPLCGDLKTAKISEAGTPTSPADTFAYTNQVEISVYSGADSTFTVAADGTVTNSGGTLTWSDSRSFDYLTAGDLIAFNDAGFVSL